MLSIPFASISWGLAVALVITGGVVSVTFNEMLTEVLELSALSVTLTGSSNRPTVVVFVKNCHIPLLLLIC